MRGNDVHVNVQEVYAYYSHFLVISCILHSPGMMARYGENWVERRKEGHLK